MSEPPPTSRITRPGERRYRTARASWSRIANRRGGSFEMAQLVRKFLQRHRLTEAVRVRSVCLAWHEIAGAKLDAVARPTALADGVLHVAADSSTMVHELRYKKRALIDGVNRFVDANRAWLGAGALVSDMRFGLAAQQREPLVDREQVRALREHDVRRREVRPPLVPPLPAAGAERAAIAAEASSVEDPGLRALIESVRTKWNR